MRRRISIALLAIIALMNFAAPLQAKPGAGLAKTFDINRFEQNIRKELDNKCIGYAYAINQGGQLKKSGAGGYAVLKRDVPNNVSLEDPKGVPQSPSKRMNIASISKTITATTVLKILQDKMVEGEPGLTVDSPVAKFLPPSWLGNSKGIGEIAAQAQAPGVSQLTFKELLSQLSGMNMTVGGSTDMTSLRKWIGAGVTRPKSQYEYINANIAIFRVIIPMMLMKAAERQQFANLAATNLAEFDKQVSARYIAHVNDLVLKPMGIQNASCQLPNDPLPTRFYRYPDSLLPSSLTGDWTLKSGGGGWYLSAIELARFLAHLQHNDNILTPGTRRTMNAFKLGWMQSIMGEHGDYYSHGGDLFYTPNVPKPAEENIGDTFTIPIGKNGMTGCIMVFPNGVQVSLLVNSLGAYKSKRALLRDAFDGAWVLGQKGVGNGE